VRAQIEKEVSKKQAELDAMERDLHAARAVLAAFKELLRKIPAEGGASSSPLPTGWGKNELRPGSDATKARQAILKAGKPLHLTEILSVMGRADTKKNRLSVASSLANYARKGQHFVKTGPNIFWVLGVEEPKTPTLVQDSLPKAG
jgi:hypothetical protein